VSVRDVIADFWQARCIAAGVRDLMQDVRFGARMLAKSPGFTSVALLTLMLGAGANTAIFSLVNAVLLRPLPFHDPDRLVMVWEDASKIGFPRNTPSPGDYSDWKADKQIFEDVAALDRRSANLTGDGEPEQIEIEYSTHNLFTVLGVRPILGRLFTREEDTPGANRVAVISHALWRRRFAGTQTVVGRPIFLDGIKYIVVGVMPQGFSFPERETSLWLPMAFTPERLAQRGNHYLQVIARLRPGVSLLQANAELKVMAEAVARNYPENGFIDRFFVEVLRDYYTQDVRRGLIVLVIAVGCILLIACANVANLLLARGIGRAREVGVRMAMGASRGRVVRQLLTESILLAVAGGFLGLLIAQWCFAFLKSFIPEDLTPIAHVTLDWRVLAFSMLIILMSGILFGIAPAIHASRLDLNDVLKEGGRGAVGGRKAGLREVFATTEAALSLLLLIGAILMLRSFSNLRGVDPGFRADHVLALRVNVPDSRYGSFTKRSEFFDRVLERVRALPGVQNAAFTSVLPLTNKGGTSDFKPQGQLRRPGVVYDACNRVVSPAYFETMRIPIQRGRSFDVRDGASAPPVAIINETMARQFWPGEDPIGNRFRFGGSEEKNPWVTIVGVNEDVRNMGLGAPVKAEMSFPYWQAKNNWMVPLDLVIRTIGDPMSLAGGVRRTIWSIDRNQPVSDIQTLDDLLDNEVMQRRLQARLLGGFAALALALACVGMYGVLAYLVTQRTKEIGVRLALGAEARDILRTVARRGMVLAGSGMTIGILGALALSRFLSSMLFDISGKDPMIYASAVAIFAGVALAACSIPAVKASRIDPVLALRNE
jgi:putative ABC transport system permease protein